jgi:hypothetical protein
LVDKTQDLDTRIFLPGWWVQAYDSASTISVEKEVGAAEILACGTGPVMSTVELNLLASILSHFQSQMFTNGLSSVSVSASKMFHEAKSFPSNRKAALERVLSGLGGLRVMESTADEARSIPLFASESWSNRDGDWELKLQTSSQGADLIFGYTDPYFRLLYEVEKSSSSDMSKSDCPPISLWKSVWLDLQGTEQGILLQLEKRMQWTNEWLHLEGVFETNLDALFFGLRLPSGKERSSDFVKRLKVLEKLGRKLVDHGFLAGSFESRFLTFDGEAPKNFHLGWQIARERLLGEEFWRYGLRVASTFAHRALAPGHDDWFRLLASGLAVSKTKQVSDLVFPELAKITDEIDCSPVFVGGNKVLPFPQLFVEWLARQHTGHPLPLPQDLKASEAGKLASPRSRLPIAERFNGFVREIADHPSYADALNNTKFATMVSGVTKATQEFREWAEKASARGGKAHLGSSAYVEEAKPQLVFSRPSEDSLGEGDAIKDSRVTQHKTGEAAAKIRKIAMEELLRMKSQSAEKYADLRKSYFDSLDEGERRLIMDVQRRMQSATFEDHLKAHLIKYMIENPASWGSGRTATKNQPVI